MLDARLNSKTCETVGYLRVTKGWRPSSDRVVCGTLRKVDMTTRLILQDDVPDNLLVVVHVVMAEWDH
jgi:hypothetical protein